MKKLNLLMSVVALLLAQSATSEASTVLFKVNGKACYYPWTALAMGYGWNPSKCALKNPSNGVVANCFSGAGAKTVTDSSGGVKVYTLLCGSKVAQLQNSGGTTIVVNGNCNNVAVGSANYLKMNCANQKSNDAWTKASTPTAKKKTAATGKTAKKAVAQKSGAERPDVDSVVSDGFKPAPATYSSLPTSTGKPSAVASTGNKETAAVETEQPKDKYGYKYNDYSDVYGNKGTSVLGGKTTTTDADGKVDTTVVVTKNSEIERKNAEIEDKKIAINDAYQETKDTANADYKDARAQIKQDYKAQNSAMTPEEKQQKLAAAKAAKTGAIDKAADEKATLEKETGNKQAINKGEAQKEKTYADADDMRKENQEGYGGRYGGANVETTTAINMGVKTLTNVTSQLATSNATNQNNTEINNISQQGTAATQKAMNESQAKMMETSAKSNSQLGVATTIMAAAQGYRIYSHTNSVKKVTAASGRANAMSAEDLAARKSLVEQDRQACMSKYATSPSFQAQCNADANREIDRYTAQNQDELQNVRINKQKESDAQKNAAVNQGIATFETTAQAALALKSAAELKKQAAALRSLQYADESNFSFNPGAVTANPTPDTSAIVADPSAVYAEDSALPGTDGMENTLNPNIAENMGGPEAGKFNSEAPKMGQGGGGGGVGSAGGTSASKDDAAKGEVAQGKTASGTYSAGEGSGSKFSRSGGSGSVGMDGGIGDLLKKFLPGGEEEKKADDNLAFGDRTPASDQAAVLGRNQNIFEAIHKRYQKKHTEGAIIFVGDKG